MRVDSVRAALIAAAMRSASSSVSATGRTVEEPVLERAGGASLAGGGASVAARVADGVVVGVVVGVVYVVMPDV